MTGAAPFPPSCVSAIELGPVDIGSPPVCSGARGVFVALGKSWLRDARA